MLESSSISARHHLVEASAQQTELSHQVDLGAVYDAHRRLLVGTAISRFGIGADEAETLMHDVFLAYILKAGEVLDTRAWLLSAICNASRHYVRTRARAVELSPAAMNDPDPASLRVMDQLPDAIGVRECFECLTPRCQLALRLRYLEGYSVPEIAVELETSAKYAQKLVSRCLQQAYQRYESGGKSQ